jgi:hypothetical protein
MDTERDFLGESQRSEREALRQDREESTDFFEDSLVVCRRMMAERGQ